MIVKARTRLQAIQCFDAASWTHWAGICSISLVLAIPTFSIYGPMTLPGITQKKPVSQTLKVVIYRCLYYADE